jgi:uncharacterized phage-associated protein
MDNTAYRKTANTVLYLLERCRDARPGVTHLLKMMWYADYWHYQRELRFVTGGDYIAAERGPVFVGYEPLFQQMEADGALEKHEVPVFGVSRMKVEYEPLMEADESVFTESELRVLACVVDECGEETGNSLSNRTHSEGPWPMIWDAESPAKRIPRIALRWIENLPIDNDIVKAKAKEALARPNVERHVAELLGGHSNVRYA